MPFNKVISRLLAISAPGIPEEGLEKRKLEFIRILMAMAHRRGWLKDQKKGLPINFHGSLKKSALLFAVFLLEWGAVSAKGGEDLFAVFLRVFSGAVPGPDTQIIFLCDYEGNCLDKLSCVVNSRWTRHYSPFPLYTLQQRLPTDEDPTQFVISLIVQNNNVVFENFSHELLYNGKRFPFQDEKGFSIFSIWHEKGLCRVAIRNKKFNVIFPDLQEPV